MKRTHQTFENKTFEYFIPMSSTQQNALLEEYGLYDGKFYFNPITQKVVKKNTNNRRRIYNILINDIQQQQQQEVKEREVKVQETIVVDHKYSFKPIIDALYNLKGKNLRVEWNGNVYTLTIPTERPAKIISNFILNFMVDSQVNVFEQYVRDHKKPAPPVYIYVLNDVVAERKSQDFREGITNCLLSPILDWAQDKAENAKSYRTQKRYEKICKDIEDLIDEFSNGVPEDKIQFICDKLQIGIRVCLPLIDEKYIECSSMKKPLRTFKFNNIRLDHVEKCNFLTSDNIEINEIKTKEEMQMLVDKCEELNEFYTYTKSGDTYTSVTTLKFKCILKSDYMNTINDFELKTDLVKCKIDDIDDKELSEFVRDGCHYNETVDFNIDIDEKELKHADMKLAYTQSKECIYYNGFLGKITDFRKCYTLPKHNGEYVNGLYRITNISFQKCKDRQIIEHLNIYVNGNIYPLPDLLFLMKHNITFNVVEGCWGSSIEFDFPDKFLEKENGVRLYCKYVGSCNSYKIKKRIFMKGDYEFFQNMKSYSTSDIEYNSDLQEGCISYTKQHAFHLSHITSYIASYQRLSTLEQLLELQFEDIRRVCVDGIYYRGDMKLKNVFRRKDEIKLGNESGDSYISGLVKNYKICNNDYKDFHMEELCAGAGGSGKTHINLIDNGLIRPLYISPSWKLARTKQEEYKVDVNVVARLCSPDPNIYQRFQQYHNSLLFDEVSMMNKETLDLIRKRYPTHKLIFCGDIGYQLPCILGDKLKIDDFENVKYFNKNYRVQDDRLLGILQNMRKYIDCGMRTVGMVSYIKRIMKDRIIEQKDINYDINDTIICNTNIQKDLYTEMYKGKFDIEKYYIRTNKYKGYNNGSIHIGNKLDMMTNKKDYEIRHAFTIHSIQGETCNNKLFIDMNKISSCQMLYTAISRARRTEQIYLIV